ncbi:NYN domain-containing protein [Novosphingobium sp. MMS21-SN21R]|uniref:NYN domain-containing protein n=1 Tax=Novosphingobium sp. MMS21-SN21R TaxID=2969298 RepID=UPI0028874D92|nr:NYN domain-containing protein [Novosphingobium sp. MMS21-SN21R]MDT0506928.1 NYN domain-containing protein [Novosphingobium sp. MMS21-SN21R]
MERISSHAIDNQTVDGCKPIALNIGMYIDGYGAKKSTDVLYDRGDKELYEHLRGEAKGDVALHKRLYDAFHCPPAPAFYAEILSFCLALVELHVVAVIEDRYRAAGTSIRPNALLVNQSNPLEIDLQGLQHNVLEALFPASDEEWQAGHYLDVACEGTIYSTGKIDRERQAGMLRRELDAARRVSDTSRVAWLERNLATIAGGVFHYRNQDGSIGGPVDFDFTESFYEEVSDRVGYYSRLGESKVHWRQDLGDFGEKGVDCDLIMQVMDDLHADKVDAFVFMTNDMDFFPLIERIRAEGKAVFLCGLEGSVSYRLIRAAGRDAFFDLTGPQMLASLATVFMAAKKPSMRVMALQWAFLAMTRARRLGS